MLSLLRLIAAMIILLLIISLSVGVELFLIFMILKLCGVIDWSWLTVCIPIIAWGCALFIYVLIIVFSDV